MTDTLVSDTAKANSSDPKANSSTLGATQVGGGCSIGIKHVSGWDDDPDNDGISCRRLNRSEATPEVEKKPWSIISSCGPGIRDQRQYAFQQSLADIYPTMSYQCLNRLPEFLDPQRPQSEVIKEQAELLDHYRQQVHDLDVEYLRARRAGQKLFENPLSLYQEPLMDPTLPPEKQPVTLGIHPNQLKFLGEHLINVCGDLEPRPFGGDFILFQNTIKPQ